MGKHYADPSRFIIYKVKHSFSKVPSHKREGETETVRDLGDQRDVTTKFNAAFWTGYGTGGKNVTGKMEKLE